MMVLPGLSAPLARPAWIMLRAGRSFTEPPGLNHSALAANSTLGNSRPTLLRRSRGVFPMQSRTVRPAAARLDACSAEMCLAAIVVTTVGHLVAVARRLTEGTPPPPFSASADDKGL